MWRHYSKTGTIRAELTSEMRFSISWNCRFWSLIRLATLQKSCFQGYLFLQNTIWPYSRPLIRLTIRRCFLFESYAYFDTKRFEKGLNRVWWIFCTLFFKKVPFVFSSISDAALIFEIRPCRLSKIVCKIQQNAPQFCSQTSDFLNCNKKF